MKRPTRSPLRLWLSEIVIVLLLFCLNNKHNDFFATRIVLKYADLSGIDLSQESTCGFSKIQLCD